MDASFVQWAGVIIGSIALAVSIRNILLTQTKNARDATFKMLDRWTADAMREARHKVLHHIEMQDSFATDVIYKKMLDDHDKEQTRVLRTQHLEASLSTTPPAILQLAGPQDIAELRRRCDADAFVFPIVGQYFDSLERGQCPEDLIEHRSWYLNLFTELDQLRPPAFSEEERDRMWSKAYQAYKGTKQYTVDLAEKKELRVAFIHIAQVLSELKALLDAKVVDRSLTKTLFNQSLREWHGRIHRIVNSRDDGETKWIDEQASIFPFQLDLYEPPTLKSWIKGVCGRLPEPVLGRIRRCWHSVRATFSPNSVPVTQPASSPPARIIS